MKATSRCALLLIGMFFCVFVYGGFAVAADASAPQDLTTAQVQPAQPAQPDASVAPAPVPDTAGPQVLNEIVIVGIPGTVTKIHDGDTFNVNLNVAGCPDVFCKNLPVRLHGIDAPEMNGKCAQEKAAAKLARDYLAGMITGKTLDLRDVGRDKFFRVDASVFVDGASVGDKMIEQGLARTYSGGKRSGWCGTSNTTV